VKRPPVFVLPLAAVLLTGCDAARPSAEADAPAVRSEIAPADRPMPVRTVRLEPSTFTEHFEVTGVVRPWREYALAAEFGGLVREVGFDRGDRVEAGQVLARIGDDLARARLDQARADLLASEANFEKMSRLVERDAAPRQDLVAATARRDRDRAAVAEGEARLDRSVVRSPVRGTVVERAIDPGEVAPPGAPVATVQDDGRLKIEVSVPDTEIGRIGVDGRATIRVDARPGERIPARVRYVAPSADPVTRTFPVELVVGSTDAGLRPGLVVRAEMERGQVDGAVAAPLEALVVGVDGTVAFVVEDCRAHRRPVRTGGSEGDTVLVLEGLSVGDELVVQGQRDLGDGQRVTSGTCP